MCSASVLGNLVGTMRAGLTLTTVVKLGIHLLNERMNPKYRARRSVMQAPVAFDVYKRLLLKTHPEFSTFFTNHVAGMMHRYWKFAFPEDFEASEAETLDAFHAGSIEYAMDVANEQISRLMSYCERDQAQLVVASSMGQEAIDRGAYEGEWRIEDTSMFLNMLGWRGEVHNALAMQPDFNFVLKSQHDAESFVAHLLCANDAIGKSIWKRSAVSGATVNMGLSPSATALADGEFWFSVPSGERRCVSIADAGISKINRDPGTGYHQPRGSLLWWNGKNGASDASRREIELTSVRAMILEAFGVDE